MDAGKINAVLLEQLDKGVINKSKSLAVIKLTNELIKVLTDSKDVIFYENDCDEVKTKSNIIIELMMDMASNDARYNPNDIKKAISILQALDGNIRELEAWYGPDMPAILTIYKSDIAVVVKREYSETLTEGVITPVEVFPLG